MKYGLPPHESNGLLRRLDAMPEGFILGLPVTEDDMVVRIKTLQPFRLELLRLPN
ncbi:MAG: hypothetical protein ACQR33_06660 [Candidatus Saccharibacteria bacterium]